MRQRGGPNEQVCHHQPWAAGYVLFLVAALVWSQTSCSDTPEEPMLTILQGGRQIELPEDGGEAMRALVVASERQLSAANGLLRLAVSTESIEALRHGETVIEIRYPAPRPVILEALGKHEIQVDGLLVPLTGEFAQGEIATFFVHHGTWKPGPYRKDRGIPELRSLAEKLGVPLNPEP